MTGTMTDQILRAHQRDGRHDGGDWRLGVDQVLLQDATGTMALLELAELGADRIAVPLAVLYVDHNLLQLDHRNPEDHQFLQTSCARLGLHFSRPGNGICHQLHVERFARPGALLLGADSHTPTSGAVGCLAIGTGGVDVATALAGEPLELEPQRVFGVRLEGRLAPWTSGKDLVLELLRRLGVRGGLGAVFELVGPGAAAVPMAARITVCNMIAELGATSALFPADEVCRAWLAAQGRAEQHRPLAAAPDARYDEELELVLDDLEPLVACPPSPGNVRPVRELEGLPVAQVCFGSSVNSAYEDLALPAALLRGATVATRLQSVTLNPGSRQILRTIARTGVLTDLAAAGVRILEPGCGPCVGMGAAPPEGQPSVRTFNRNFPGRSGTWNDAVYLVSPATAAATALRGALTDPRALGDEPRIVVPAPELDDSQLLAPPPADVARRVAIATGRNIRPPPPQRPLPDALEGRVLIVLGDDVSTGSMSPDGAQVMADRSNVAAIAAYVFIKEDRGFVRRAREAGEGFIVAGSNYGQGSSREHAVLAPKYLGVRAVFARSFARIHRRNLVQQGLLPLVVTAEVAARARLNERWRLPRARAELEQGAEALTVEAPGGTFAAGCDLNARERSVVLDGGILAHLKRRGGAGAAPAPPHD